jgi:hypothetical protein
MRAASARGLRRLPETSAARDGRRSETPASAPRRIGADHYDRPLGRSPEGAIGAGGDISAVCERKRLAGAFVVAQRPGCQALIPKTQGRPDHSRGEQTCKRIWLYGLVPQSCGSSRHLVARFGAGGKLR